MKKLVSLLLALLMVFGAVSALADLADYFDVDESYDKSTNTTTWKYYRRDTGDLIYTESAAPGSKSSETIVHYQWYYQSHERVGTVNTDTWEQSLYLLDANGNIDGAFYDDGNFNKVQVDKHGRLNEAILSDGREYYDGKWHDADGNEIGDVNIDKLLEKARKLLKGKVPSTKPVWYTNNTACVMGISLRDEFPGMTSKWYNVLPVDISHDGTQTFHMIASNIYFLGSITVTVSGDDITTTYSYPTNRTYEIYPQDECLAWFTGVEEISGAFLENPVSDMKFGQAVSREKDLNGQETALLFVCNHVSYRVPFNSNGAMPSRAWRNSSKFAEYFTNAHILLAKLEIEYSVNKETATADMTSSETADAVAEIPAEDPAAAVEAAAAAVESAAAALESATAALEAAQAAAAEATANETAVEADASETVGD